MVVSRLDVTARDVGDELLLTLLLLQLLTLGNAHILEEVGDNTGDVDDDTGDLEEKGDLGERGETGVRDLLARGDLGEGGDFVVKDLLEMVSGGGGAGDTSSVTVAG